MTFDKILDNNTLWAVRYDDAEDNALQLLFSQWNDPEWLVDFFMENMSDLESYFKITDINQAIYDTIDDSMRMQCLILEFHLTQISTVSSDLCITVVQVRSYLVRRRLVSRSVRNTYHGCEYMQSNWNQDVISLQAVP